MEPPSAPKLGVDVNISSGKLIILEAFLEATLAEH